MKNFFNFLQDKAILIALFYGISPATAQALSEEFGFEMVFVYCAFIATSGTIIFAAYLLYATLSFTVPHKGYLTASGYSGFVGSLVGYSSLAFLDGLISIDTQQTIVQISFTAMTGILYGFLIEWVIIPWNKKS